MNNLPDVQSEEINSLFGKYTRYFITKKTGKSSTYTITVPENGDYEKIHFHLQYEKETRNYGKDIFSVDIPNEGLAITKACNGFGSGTSTSYIVTKVMKKTKKINRCTGVKVYIIDENMAWVNMDESCEFELCKGKSGKWKTSGTHGAPLIYFIHFGNIEEIDMGYDK